MFPSFQVNFAKVNLNSIHCVERSGIASGVSLSMEEFCV